MRRGINSKNFHYWFKDIFTNVHDNPQDIAKLNAHRICHEQEIETLKSRIIKLEKQFKKLNQSK